MLKAAGIVLLTAVSLSCASAPEPRTSENRAPESGYPKAQCAPTEGFSGMAQLGPNRYLVVHDTKGGKDGPRLGLLEIAVQGQYRCSLLEAEDWKNPDGLSSDLESACPLSGRPGEVLVAESGDFEKKHGRIFHLRIFGQAAEVIRPYPLPILAKGTEKETGDEYEGLACQRQSDGRYLLLLGERGGSQAYPTGLLRWGWFDPQRDSLEWAEDGRANLPVKAPGEWPAKIPKRDITDLLIDDTGMLWAAAAVDPDQDKNKNGPFRSVVYQVGRLTGVEARPVDVEPNPSIAWAFEGLKIEALGPAAPAVPLSSMSIATEDENYGGVWRPLFPAAARAPE